MRNSFGRPRIRSAKSSNSTRIKAPKDGKLAIASFMIGALPILTSTISLIPESIEKTLQGAGEALDEAMKAAFKSVGSGGKSRD